MALQLPRPRVRPNPMGLSPRELETLRRVEAKLEAKRIAEEARFLEDDLFEFARAAWHLVEPVKLFLSGWHLEAICEHLEGALEGEIDLLLISMPPGHMKSILCSVMFPAWIWCKRPGFRLLTACYSKDFAERDAVASKLIIESHWYQARWPLQLKRDTNRKDRYENTERGYRVTTTPQGRATGEGGSMVIGDDLISMGDVYSPAKRAAAIHWLTDVVPTRLRDETPGSTIIIGQRGHEVDPIGYLLSENIPGTVHLNLPARFDPTLRKDTRWFQDPRTIKGEVLWPALYPERRLRKVERRMTADGAAAQLQQTPTVGGGSILPRSSWRLWMEWQLPRCDYYIVSVDPSMKDGKHNDPWACTVWGHFRHLETAISDRPTTKREEIGCLILLEAWAGHMSYPEAKRKILQTRESWTLEGIEPDATVIEDKAAGPILIAEFEKAGMDGLHAYDPLDVNKAVRADRVSDILTAGRIWVPTRKLRDGSRHETILPPWAETAVAQCASFPAGAHDDLVDTCTQAWKHAREEQLVDLDTDIDRHPSATKHSPPETGRPRESAYG